MTEAPPCCRYSERSNTKCVGITIETRPDYCLKRHLSDMLGYGCTRLEIGVQSVYEDVARDTNRSALNQSQSVHNAVCQTTDIKTSMHTCYFPMKQRFFLACYCCSFEP